MTTIEDRLESLAPNDILHLKYKDARRLLDLLAAAKGLLKHDVANLGREGDEFFSCYTYPHGTLPPEIHALKAAIRGMEESTP